MLAPGQRWDAVLLRSSAIGLDPAHFKLQVKFLCDPTLHSDVYTDVEHLSSGKLLFGGFLHRPIE